MKTNTVLSELSALGCSPSAPPHDRQNYRDGAVGDAICPFHHMHTSREDDSKRTLRFWVDRVDSGKPQFGGKIFLSCRHESCRDQVWELTLRLRKMFDRSQKRTILPTQTTNKPRTMNTKPTIKELLLEKQEKENEAPVNERMAKIAILGKTFTEEILNSIETLGTTEEDIMKMSPFPIKPNSAERNPFAQTTAFIDLFPPKSLLWFGNADDAKNNQSIRSKEDWMDAITRLASSPVTQEDYTLWPWPGRFSTSSIYNEISGGRNLENFKIRCFFVLESDSLTKKDQLRIVKALIKDSRFSVAYVLSTGSKSYHIGIKATNLSDEDRAFFTGVPGSTLPKSIQVYRKPARFAGMGFDFATVREVQPVRYPGPVNPKTGRFQRLLYLDPSLSYDCIPGYCSGAAQPE